MQLNVFEDLVQSRRATRHFIDKPVPKALLARLLGPTVYGNFMYLNNFFENIIQLGDSGSSICYYTKLSKYKQQALINFYFLYSFLLFFILILVVVRSPDPRLVSLICPDLVLSRERFALVRSRL